MSFVIKDWAGNTCFHGKTFKTFDDADSFLSERFEHLSDEDYEEERGEYWIEEKPQKEREKRYLDPQDIRAI